MRVSAGTHNGLETFLADPAAMFPGLWMSMRGLEDAAERRSLVRF